MSKDNHINQKKIETLLGTVVYQFHQSLCEHIISLLSPNKEAWDGASRRGRYYHGFWEISSKDIISINMWLDRKDVLCQIQVSRRKLTELVKYKYQFSKEIQDSIESCIIDAEKYSNPNYEFYLIFGLTELTLSDVIEIMQQC